MIKKRKLIAICFFITTAVNALESQKRIANGEYNNEFQEAKEKYVKSFSMSSACEELMKRFDRCEFHFGIFKGTDHKANYFYSCEYNNNRYETEPLKKINRPVIFDHVERSPSYRRCTGFNREDLIAYFMREAQEEIIKSPHSIFGTLVAENTDDGVVGYIQFSDQFVLPLYLKKILLPEGV